MDATDKKINKLISGIAKGKRLFVAKMEISSFEKS